MATPKFVNRARMLTSTTGTGSSLTLTAAVFRYFTFSEAGLQDGDVVDYVIEDGNDFEIQIGQTYNSSGPSLSRGTPAASKVGGVAGTSQISLSGNAQVFITAVAESFDISRYTQKSSPAATDLLLAYDSDAGGLVNLLLGSIFPLSLVNVQVFASSGTYTPHPQMRTALVFLTGGGGGGGGVDASSATNTSYAAGGGGAGGTAIGFITRAQALPNLPVVIGAGGSGGPATGGDGSDGGYSDFGGILYAEGGGGGLGGVGGATLAHGGWGGLAYGGLINMGGGDGGQGIGWYNVRFVIGGFGGGSFWGGGARGATATNSTRTYAGSPGRNPGSGGSGGAIMETTTGAAGGAGGSGICVVLEFG